jgi:pilus assembly protein Flp/PilA
MARSEWRAKKETEMNVISRIREFVRDEEGQDLIEYALLAALIALGAVTAMTATGGSVNSVFGNIKTKLDSSV